MKTHGFIVLGWKWWQPSRTLQITFFNLGLNFYLGSQNYLHRFYLSPFVKFNDTSTKT